MTFCIAPFVHMVQNPDGQYRTCCMYDKPLEGNYKDIKEAFDSEENNIIRQRMLSGESLPECNKCDIDEKHDGKIWPSYRNYFNTKYSRDFVDNPTLKTLEISVSNKCNLKCIDCGPRFSDQFGPTITNTLPTPNYFKDVEHIKILGGEPFLDKRNIELLKSLDRQNTHIMIITNNTIFPDENTLSILDEFKQLDINISIDGINDVAEFVREGTKWSRFERNWNKWKKFWFPRRERCRLIPHIVVHSYNAPFIQETIDWLSLPIEDISWDFLDQPDWLNVSYLPVEIKQYILDSNLSLKLPLEKFIYSNEYNENIFSVLREDIFKRDIPKSMDNYINMFY